MGSEPQDEGWRTSKRMLSSDVARMRVGESALEKRWCARHSPRQQSPPRTIRGHQLRGHPRVFAGIRAVRSRTRLVHRRHAAAARRLRASQQRHATARRARRDEPHHSGQLAAHSTREDHSPSRRLVREPDRRAHRVRDAPRSPRRGRRRPLPRRSVLPLGGVPHSPASAARAARGSTALGRSFRARLEVGVGAR